MVSDGQSVQFMMKSGGLNPCCNGIWSQTSCDYSALESRLGVLILVVMEYGLRQEKRPPPQEFSES